MKKSSYDILPGGKVGLFFSTDMGEARCVGHLRGDFGSGEEFWTSWWPHNDDRFNTQDFKDDFYPLVNALRRNLLKSRAAMYKYIADHPSAVLEDSTPRSYGYRVHTEKYSYYIRCMPERGDYNVYVFCYLREGL